MHSHADHDSSGSCLDLFSRQSLASSFQVIDHVKILAIQVNVELLTIDKRTFTTDEGNSLQTLFGENSEGSAQYRAEIQVMANRLATVFASLKVQHIAHHTISVLPADVFNAVWASCKSQCHSIGWALKQAAFHVLDRGCVMHTGSTHAPSCSRTCSCSTQELPCCYQHGLGSFIFPVPLAHIYLCQALLCASSVSFPLQSQQKFHCVTTQCPLEAVFGIIQVTM